MRDIEFKVVSAAENSNKLKKNQVLEGKIQLRTSSHLDQWHRPQYCHHEIIHL